jgi:hypothetical protein
MNMNPCIGDRSFPIVSTLGSAYIRGGNLRLRFSRQRPPLLGTVPTVGPRAWTCIRPLDGRGGYRSLAPWSRLYWRRRGGVCSPPLMYALPLSNYLGDSLFGSLYCGEYP